jgi:hypothetical protein
MLFDLRGRWRRRSVQAIYVTLAVLMGGGLIFFGIGGSVSGGLFDAIGLTGNSNSTGGAGDILAKQQRAAERRVQLNPNDAAGWAELTRIHFQRAGQGANYDQARSQFKSGGISQLRQASAAWDRYVALDKSPDPGTAALVVQAYVRSGLKPTSSGVLAGEVVASAQPSAIAYFNLAVLAYSAGQARKGDLAAQKAVQESPAADRPSVKSQLDALKKQGGASTGSAGSSAVSPSG